MKHIKKSILAINATYIIAILTAIIIGLISVEWSKVPNLTDYINFALAMSSLILAILAIIYAFYSGGALHKTLGDISDSAVAIKTTSKSITRSNQKIKKEISKIPAALSNVEQKIDLSNETLQALKEPQETNIKDNENEILNDDVVHQYIKKSPTRGCQALLAAATAYKLDIDLSFKDLEENIKSLKGSANFMTVYLISSASLGIISYKYGTSSKIKITDANKYLISNIDNLCKEKYKEVAEQLAKDEKAMIAMFERDHAAIIDYLNTKK